MNIFTKTMSLAKIFYNFKKRNIILDTFPIKFWIESTSACNLRCTMCPNKEVAADMKGRMSLALFKNVVDQVATFANDIYIHHRGEPFLNPDLFDMIRYAKAKGLAVRFHSNGCLLDQEKAEKLLDAAPDLISFSIDGFDKESYEEIRVGGTFEKTVENVINLAHLKKEGRFSQPYIVVERIDFKKHRTREHKEVIQHMTRQFLDAGVDEVIAKEEYEWAVADPSKQMMQQDYSVCTFPWYAMVICFDGTVTPCPQDYMADMDLGNVNNKSIREIWNDTPYQSLREKLVRDVPSLALCKQCDRIMRKEVGGIPLQYAWTFLADQYLGYGKLRKLIGTHERN